MTISLADFPPDIVTVLRALAREMQGKPIEPHIVRQAFLKICDVLPGHSSLLHYVPHSPKPAKPRTRIMPHYVLTIAGPRTDGRWSFRPGKLSNLLKSAAT